MQLLSAVNDDSPSRVRAALALGAAVDGVRDPYDSRSDRFSPMRMAVVQGRSLMVSALLSAGAKVKPVTYRQDGTVTEALKYKQLKVAHVLLQHLMSKEDGHVRVREVVEHAFHNRGHSYPDRSLAAECPSVLAFLVRANWLRAIPSRAELEKRLGEAAKENQQCIQNVEYNRAAESLRPPEEASEPRGSLCSYRERLNRSLARYKTVGEQLYVLLRSCEIGIRPTGAVLDWSPETHARFHPAFRARARALLLCARRQATTMPTEQGTLGALDQHALYTVIGALARRYWDGEESGSCGVPCPLVRPYTGRPSEAAWLHHVAARRLQAAQRGKTSRAAGARERLLWHSSRAAAARTLQAAWVALTDRREDAAYLVTVAALDFLERRRRRRWQAIWQAVCCHSSNAVP